MRQRTPIPRLLRAMESIGGDTEPLAVLRRTAATAAELAGARFAAVAVLNDDGNGIGHLVTHGDGPPPDDLVRALLDGTSPRTPDTLRVPVLVHGAKFGALQVSARADGRPFTAEIRQLLRVLATEAGIALGNARLHEAIRVQSRWMDSSFELSTTLLSDDEDNALAVVAEQARRLAGATTGAVLEPTGDRGLQVVAASAEAPRGLIGTVLPGHVLAVRQVLAGEPVVLDDPVGDPRMHMGLTSAQGPGMLLPLASDGTVLGALALSREPGAPPYTVQERALTIQFAQQAALALLLARARRDREQLAVLEDRDRIARDLHDLVIQRLFAVGMVLEGARRAAPAAAERIETATRELDATIQEIRTAIFALQQPPDEAPSGLRTRVLRETGAAATTLGFAPSVAFGGPVDALVGEEVAGQLVAALREGLSNAARHARASRVDVTVDAAGTLPDGRPAVTLTVSDDGVGVPPDVTRRSGLRNIRDRAVSLGGEASTGPGPDGKGTTLTWRVPR
ncbi:GAF domain-containing protein [Streptomyces sp. RFCAC02]|uniref:sensor histidine kinase n=1 Tax=Streptomyces sp. RFCAC02 TaxID=2499143 RepID=UPI001F108D1F|nr:GAF domain-containing protein [Streptomyces sp. RFCAC02]